MKRFISLLLSMCIIFSSISIVSLANDDISVYIDGEKLAFDVTPQIIDDRTMVPLRAIFEALEAEVSWDEKTRTVTSTKGDVIISLTINEPILNKNGSDIALDVSPVIVGGRTLVPVRAIAESFNTDVKWDGDSRSVLITSKDDTVCTSDGDFAADLDKSMFYNSTEILDFGKFAGIEPIGNLTDFGIGKHTYNIDKLPENTIEEYVKKIKEEGFQAILSYTNSYEFFDDNFYDLKLTINKNKLTVEYIYDSVKVDPYAENINVPDFGSMIGKATDVFNERKTSSYSEYVYSYNELEYNDDSFTHNDYIRYLTNHGYMINGSDERYLYSYNLDENISISVLNTLRNGKFNDVKITVKVHNDKKNNLKEDSNTYYGVAQYVKSFSNVFRYKESDYRIINNGDGKKIHYYLYNIPYKKYSDNMYYSYVELLLDSKFVRLSSSKFSSILENKGINYRVCIYNHSRRNVVIVLLSKIDESKKDDYYDEDYFGHFVEFTISEKINLIKYTENSIDYMSNAVTYLDYFIDGFSVNNPIDRYYNMFYEYKNKGRSEIWKAYVLCCKYEETKLLAEQYKKVADMLDDMNPTDNYKIYDMSYLGKVVLTFGSILETLNIDIMPRLNELPNNIGFN